jgi:hypothetical protein
MNFFQKEKLFLTTQSTTLKNLEIFKEQEVLFLFSQVGASLAIGKFQLNIYPATGPLLQCRSPSACLG